MTGKHVRPAFLHVLLFTFLSAGLAIAGGFTPSMVLRSTYVIDFGAFTAGVNQTSSQTLTGIAMGDACVVGTATDLSASIGQMSARPTAAGTVLIIISPITTASTANPASDTFTVSCVRTS